MRQVLTLLPFLAAACAPASPDPRGVEKGETFLTISATGRAEARPNEARMQLGVTSQGANAGEASRLNREKMARVTAALTRLGIKEEDLQTRNLSLQRIDYGRERGQYRASNIVEVRMTDVARVGEAVTTVTEAGANVVGGPDLRVSDREAANRSAYANAYKAARSRAEAYADAAGLKIVRTVNIVDGGEYGVPSPSYVTMDAAAPPPAVAPQRMVMPEQAVPAAPPPPPGAPFNPGVNRTEVRVRVDFALKPA
ncbi:SIMPL domain-containing protein [Sphingomonas glaciei]|uniref:SIMPL domain-containing protein n=1 Tax=Sphingomonas glaciei TaxID=2938948 RepID=A0ABY5MTZ9_9SPHN|nr:SIMPL domain-containing protein [Sphingomonas glaciei]UUR07439.1 SIMPL domain-containing protein [Sphingomonas glaciei]